jgi:uncharacterized protein (TIGR00266 family)
MQTEIRHSPSFALAHVTLESGEKLRVESGAMAAHSAGVELEAKMEGGLMRSLKRSVLGGESMFISSYTAPAGGGWVDVAARLPGDAFIVEVQGSYILTRGSFVACSAELEIETKWGGFGNLLGGEGGFLLHISGTGSLIGSCYGALERRQLGAGETITVDSGHLVAYDTGLQITSRKAARGLVRTVKTGEDLVFDVTGPGEVITQSRNPDELVGWIIGQLPSDRD